MIPKWNCDTETLRPKSKKWKKTRIKCRCTRTILSHSSHPIKALNLRNFPLLFRNVNQRERKTRRRAKAEKSGRRFAEARQKWDNASVSSHLSPLIYYCHLWSYIPQHGRLHREASNLRSCLKYLFQCWRHLCGMTLVTGIALPRTKLSI